MNNVELESSCYKEVHVMEAIRAIRSGWEILTSFSFFHCNMICTEGTLQCYQVIVRLMCLHSNSEDEHTGVQLAIENSLDYSQPELS